MTRLLCVLLTLLISPSGPAMGENGGFGFCCLAAKGTQMEFGFIQAVERQTVARDFYRASTGLNDTQIASHMRGIDFSVV